jgi:hypothetical protein
MADLTPILPTPARSMYKWRTCSRPADPGPMFNRLAIIDLLL